MHAANARRRRNALGGDVPSRRVTPRSDIAPDGYVAISRTRATRQKRRRDKRTKPHRPRLRRAVLVGRPPGVVEPGVCSDTVAWPESSDGTMNSWKISHNSSSSTRARRSWNPRTNSSSARRSEGLVSFTLMAHAPVVDACAKYRRAARGAPGHIPDRICELFTSAGFVRYLSGVASARPRSVSRGWSLLAPPGSACAPASARPTPGRQLRSSWRLPARTP